MRSFVLAVVLLLGGAALAIWLVGSGRLGSHEGPGEVTARPLPASEVAGRAEAQREAVRGLAAPEPAKQILFGDLHVHTTFSIDAFLFSLPLLGGEGAHPPADACDFARYCAGLDFWSLNDHAEGLTPEHWRESVESIRQCNAVANDPRDPDVVAYLGWEWTQVGAVPERHYGHKNVVLLETGEGRVPARPIAAPRPPNVPSALAAPTVARRALFAAMTRDARTLDWARFMTEVAAVPECPADVPTRELPPDCREFAPTPGDLFARLRAWDLPALVIPHGTTWGFYTPAGSSWDKQLSRAQHDPELQALVEVHSGHGNSEEYRPWRAVERGPDGEPVCPEPRPDYLPSCWRAGELVAQRCLEAGLGAAECDARAAEARRLYLEAGIAGHLTVPGATARDWLDAGQCRDCFLPAFNYRPASSVQYMMALGDFEDLEEGEAPRRFRFGFLASSDNHTARPGTGYKEMNRREWTEATGADPDAPDVLTPPRREPAARAEPVDVSRIRGFGFAETERLASFLTTGGLVAVHAAGRDRQAVWDALQRREVYGTSGGRTLLWFDLVNGPDGEAPMGSEVALGEAPRFRVRAAGAFEQRPGCPEHTLSALSPERLHHLCRGECYHPGEQRRAVTRVEVVRIRPQVGPEEPVDGLVEDPWRVLPCPGDPAGCTVEFTDEEFTSGGRDTLYYVRAIEAPSLAVNGGGLRCTYDADGNCIATDPCFGDAVRTPYQDDCLAPVEERAWSSPIFVRHDPPPAGTVLAEGPASGAP